MRGFQCVLPVFACLMALVAAPSYARVWEHIGLDGRTVNAIAVDPVDPNVIFAGADDGLYRSEDGGTVWEPLEPGFFSEIKALSIEQHPLQDIYAMRSAGDSDDGVYRSTDGGESWGRILDLACGTSLMRFSDLYAGAVDDSAGGGVYRSSDGGTTWDTVNQGLDDLNVQALGAIYGFGDSANVRLAGTRGGIYRWPAADTAWSWAGPAVNASISDFGGGLYFAYAAWGNGSWSDGVYKAGILGDVWTVKHYCPYTRTVTANPINGVCVYSGALAAGVFRSTDIGETWGEMNEGLTDLDVIELAFCATDTSWLYAGTEGGGIFRFGIATGVEEGGELGSRISCPGLRDIRPNPFSTSATISYALPGACPVVIAIYDITGSHVETLVNERRQAGIHEVRWSPADNPSAVYFCRMRACPEPGEGRSGELAEPQSRRAGEFVDTRKMVVVE